MNKSRYTEAMGITRSQIVAPITLVFTAFLLHVLPFFLYGTHPLGYDTGFYRRYLIQPFASFPNQVVPGLGADALLPRLILDALRVIHVPTDLALYGSYIFFFSILPVIFYFWIKPHLGLRGAAIGGLLLALSPVGYTAFWYMLYKNAFALCLILLAFIAYERRQFWPLALLDITIALSHKTSAIIYLVTLATLVVVDHKRWRELLLHGAITAACFALVAFGGSVGGSALGTSAVAVFLEWNDYIVFSFGLFLAAGFAAFYWKTLSIPKTLIAFALAGFAFPILHLPFYERIFVFTDIALIAFAAYGLDLLFAKIDFDTESGYAAYGYFVLICIVVGLQLGNLQSRVRQLQPLETQTKLEQISTIGNLIPPEGLLLTTNAEAPWYEGWTLAHITAPGMLRDTHSFDAWVTFWESTSTPEQIAFLNTFPQPLYVSTLGNFADLISTPPPCLTKIAPNLLRNDCK
jgi:hypothetical protein